MSSWAIVMNVVFCIGVFLVGAIWTIHNWSVSKALQKQYEAIAKEACKKFGLNPEDKDAL